MGVHVNLGSMSRIQQQLAALSRQMEKIAPRLTEEAAKSAAIRAAERVEGALKKGCEVAEWNLCMFYLQSVQRAQRGGVVESPILGGDRSVEIPWTGSA